jgi:hypothetical protein
MEGDFLTFEAPAEWGLPKLRVHPESQTEFFAMELPLQVTVQKDKDGNAIRLLVQPPRGQHVVKAERRESRN